MGLEEQILIGLIKLIIWFIEELARPMERTLTESFGDDILATPLPRPLTDGADVVLAEPTRTPFTAIYDQVVFGEITVIAILILLVAFYLRTIAEIFDVGDHWQPPSKRQLWTGLILILGWWWLAMLMMMMVRGFEIALMPSDLIDITNAMYTEGINASWDNASTYLGDNPYGQDLNSVSIAIAMIFALIGGTGYVLLDVLLNIRDMLIYVYLVGMPVGFGFVYSGLPIVSGLVKRVMTRFVALLVLPIPIYVMFRILGAFFFHCGGEPCPLSIEEQFLGYAFVTLFPYFAVYIAWKLFQYSAPSPVFQLSSKAIGVGRSVGTLGTRTLFAGGLAAAGNPYAATTTMTGGVKSGVRTEMRRRQKREYTDGGGNHARRRTENDPG